ncbi:peptidoglycan-binding protein [Streptomyces sp. NBC_00365]|uniref:peptidoglycan-binding domain-containing protein n=1 Tax=Streptomyces sp. NBC_00365 TaxID=2975726 RepID=UPI00225A2ACD|nr:peptidoglycan-binding domain-containing protein [Streptomyces sp. NBC_00365]MCX5088264.1 peptidoglycan-binding protein [Streptomyces sp. NBC_00365]
MNVRKRIVLAATTAALGAGIAVGPAVSSFAASAQGATAHAVGVTQAPNSQDTWTCGYYSGHKTLKYGSRGNAVKEAQCLLKYHWKTPKGKRLSVDGKYGPGTTAAVREFQRRVNHNQHAHISVDGIVGPATWKWLRY